MRKVKCSQQHVREQLIERVFGSCFSETLTQCFSTVVHRMLIHEGLKRRSSPSSPSVLEMRHQNNPRSTQGPPTVTPKFRVCCSGSRLCIASRWIPRACQPVADLAGLGPETASKKRKCGTQPTRRPVCLASSKRPLSTIGWASAPAWPALVQMSNLPLICTSMPQRGYLESWA